LKKTVKSGEKKSPREGEQKESGITGELPTIANQGRDGFRGATFQKVSNPKTGGSGRRRKGNGKMGVNVKGIGLNSD